MRNYFIDMYLNRLYGVSGMIINNVHQPMKNRLIFHQFITFPAITTPATISKIPIRFPAFPVALPFLFIFLPPFPRPAR